MSLLDFHIPAWMANATCALENHDPELFFPGNGKNGDLDTRTVREICRRCPVVTDCLAYALEEDIPHGIWGGVTDIMRRRHRRLRGESVQRRRSNLTPDLVQQLRADRAEGATWAALGTAYGVTRQSARAAGLGHTWADVS